MKEEKPIFAMVVVVVLIIWAIYAGFVLGGVYLILLGIERIDWPFGKLVGLILLGIALVLFFAITINDKVKANRQRREKKEKRDG